MNSVLRLYRSTIGKKVVMAVTGSMMVGWLTIHMLGNLQVFIGHEAFDHYAELIQSQKEVLYILRATMLGALVLHIASVVSLIMTARAARTKGYQGGRSTLASTPAARTLRVGGVVLLVFLVWHLADLTIGIPVINPYFKHGHAFHNLTSSVARPAVAVLYILGASALGMHVYHGVYSVFQTLGINQHNHRETARQLATVLALAIAGGNILIVLAIATGLVGA